jgi:hypothetical protein
VLVLGDDDGTGARVEAVLGSDRSGWRVLPLRLAQDGATLV